MASKTGIVRWFNQGKQRQYCARLTRGNSLIVTHSVKGHGFIIQDDGGPDVYVHYSKVPGAGKHALNEGDLVSYEMYETNKGPAASSVVKK